MYEDDTIQVYLAKIDGLITLHNNLLKPLSPKIIKHYREVLANLIVSLQDRGLDHLDTWVETKDEGGIKFAEKFGFEQTGFIRIVQLGATQYDMLELRLPFGDF